MAAGDFIINPIVEYADWKKDPENYLQICVDVPGLRKKFGGDAPKNAKIKLTMTDRSFTIHVDVTLSTELKVYEYSVKQLPEAISPEESKSYTKVKRNDEVIIFLHKARPGKWARMLSSTGLETFVPEKT